MDRGAWWAAVHGVAGSRTRLSDFTFNFHFPLSCIGEGDGSPPQCFCLENPRDGGAWWAAVYGVPQSRTRLKRLSSSSSKTWKQIYKNTIQPWEIRFLPFVKTWMKLENIFKENVVYYPKIFILFNIWNKKRGRRRKRSWMISEIETKMTVTKC